METGFGIIFTEKCISVAQNKVFGISSAIISGLSVHHGMSPSLQRDCDMVDPLCPAKSL